MTEVDDTRTRILEAASARLLHYGYGKTTMSEIAKDCGMSAGNIYRFFASKLDIAEAMAHKFNDDLHEKFREISCRNISAADRLRGIFKYFLEETYTRVAAEAKILEIAEILKKERPKHFNGKLAQEREYLVKILQDGIAAGQFRELKNLNETAEFIQSSLMKFRFPQMFSSLTLDALEWELEGVLDLVLAGLSKHASVPKTDSQLLATP